MATEFTLPELGENVASADVLRVMIQPGDTVERDQPVIELETDKATVEVPSSVAGRVADVKIKAGDKVKTGQVIFTVEGGADQPARAEAPAAAVGAAPADTPEEGGIGTADVASHAGVPTAGAPEYNDASEGQEFEGDDEEEGAEPEAPEPPDARSAGTAERATPAPAETRGEPRTVEFRLPELGENVAAGDVVSVLVKVGARIERDQPALELETDKATVEVPSSVSGIVKEIRVTAGKKVTVGEVVFTVESTDGDDAGARPVGVERVHAAPAPPDATSRGRAADAPLMTPDEGMHQEVHGRRRQTGPDKPGMHEDALEEAAGDAAPREAADARAGGDGAPRAPAPAAPSVRRSARELGVDIHDVKGSGPAGRISVDDVKAHVKRMMQEGATRRAPAAGSAPVPLPDFAKWGPVERTPMRAVRRTTAERLSVAWSQIPHVTQHDEADVTVIEQLRQQFGKRAEAAGGKLTVTAVALKVVGAALKAFPQFNAAIDTASGELIVKKYVHVGIAVDTDRGLLVPVIRDVDKKNILQLSAELTQASEKARAGKTTADEMQGGCFTITNLGGIGGTHFTPIVNFPEVAILGLSRARMQPVWTDGEFVPRLMLPLSLSYDHRVIDGADAARFLRWVAEALEQPFLLSLQG